MDSTLCNVFVRRLLSLTHSFFLLFYYALLVLAPILADMPTRHHSFNYQSILQWYFVKRAVKPLSEVIKVTTAYTESLMSQRFDDLLKYSINEVSNWQFWVLYGKEAYTCNINGLHLIWWSLQKFVKSPK